MVHVSCVTLLPMTYKSCMLIMHAWIACTRNGQIFQMHITGNIYMAITIAVILEVVASHDTWIWHAFFGTHGYLNGVMF